MRAAIDAGRISVNEHGRIVDTARADLEWEANRTRPGAAPKGFPRKVVKVTAKPTIAASRAELAAVELELKRLVLKEKKGELVPRRHMQSHARRAAQIIQRHLLAVPSRCAPELHGAADVRTVERILEREMRAALAAVAREIAPGQ